MQDFITPKTPNGDDLFAFTNTYARLPERFFVKLSPSPVAEPTLVYLNTTLADELGLDVSRLASPEGVAALSGNRVPNGSEPISQVYAGHQFGFFTPQLGDGRAHLLGEIIDRLGARSDIQLKGSGRTPYSRRGDGRAALGPMLRELVIGEAMHSFGIRTTRALAVVATGERVRRECLLPGAVMTRVAASHIRVGTFQYFAARQDTEAVRVLADYSIARHYPDCLKAENRYLSFLDQVISSQAELVAQWLLVGFIHGVMNTDNMAISGETIDFGPCAFMDTYDPATVFSSVDEMGRYAYTNQPSIAHWNLTRFAECLLPLLDADVTRAVELAKEALATFAPRFEAAHLAGQRRKLGLLSARDDDRSLIGELLGLMIDAKTDYTVTFRALAYLAGPECDDRDFMMLFEDQAAIERWLKAWRARLAEEPAGDPANRQAMMLAANPIYIPRNHLVEEVLSAAERENDFEPLQKLLGVLATPFDEQPGAERYAMPPRPEEVVHQTFCGT
ncbi:MAG: YdiU family protein [Filomicrobium sp.]